MNKFFIIVLIIAVIAALSITGSSGNFLSMPNNYFVIIFIVGWGILWGSAALAKLILPKHYSQYGIVNALVGIGIIVCVIFIFKWVNEYKTEKRIQRYKDFRQQAFTYFQQKNLIKDFSVIPNWNENGKLASLSVQLRLHNDPELNLEKKWVEIRGSISPHSGEYQINDPLFTSVIMNFSDARVEFDGSDVVYSDEVMKGGYRLGTIENWKEEYGEQVKIEFSILLKFLHGWGEIDFDRELLSWQSGKAGVIYTSLPDQDEVKNLNMGGSYTYIAVHNEKLKLDIKMDLNQFQVLKNKE